MALREYIMLHIFLIIVLSTAVVYAFNIDIYREVDNMHPVQGYQDFVKSLKNAEFVEANSDAWSNSDSWVLRSLVNGNMHSLAVTELFLILGYHVSLAFLPFISLSAVCAWRRNRRKCNE